MKAICIRLLIRLLTGYLEIPVYVRDMKTEKWLADAWMTPGFRHWLSYRDARIVSQLAGGTAMDPLKHDDYVRAMGHRLENLALGFHAKNAYVAKMKQREQKLSTPPQEEAAEA